MNLSFRDKVAVVVGGTSGIGRATAAAFGEAGAKVVVAGRRETEGEQAAESIRGGGGEATFVRADVTNEADVAALMDAAVGTYGGLDCAFNNAGRDLNVGVADASLDDFAGEFDVNARGTLLCLKHELRVMRERGGGAIVNSSSVSGLVPTAAQAIYGASKAAVTHLARSAAPRPARRARSTDDDPLTAREREIAELVATGRTNREIAEELVLSTRTIEAHLRSIYGKLDVRSRVELTRAM